MNGPRGSMGSEDRNRSYMKGSSGKEEKDTKREGKKRGMVKGTRRE